MCIRDRLGVVVKGLQRQPASVGLLPQHAQDRGDGRVTLAAVSYTHLRAHETVLDLVCRLLLEKKKHSRLNNAYTHS